MEKPTLLEIIEGYLKYQALKTADVEDWSYYWDALDDFATNEGYGSYEDYRQMAKDFVEFL